ncbi:hypothetical protein EMIT0373P_30842 [Pseudomonas chlororaphis]
MDTGAPHAIDKEAQHDVSLL